MHRLRHSHGRLVCGGRRSAAVPARLLLPMLLAGLLAVLPGNPSPRPWIAPSIAFAEGMVQPRVAVVPLVDPRHPEAPDWLASFLQTGIVNGLLRSGRFVVMPSETAGFWSDRLALAGSRPAAPERLRQMGVNYLVRGTVQRVLRLARVRLRLSAADPAYSADEIAWEWEIDLDRDSPGRAIDRAMGYLLPTLSTGREAHTAPQPEEKPSMAPQPGSWETVRAFYALTGQSASTQEARDTWIVALAAFQSEPALRGKVLAATAQLLLERALLHVPDEAAREPVLSSALKAIAGALREEPWNSRWRALKGELHYLLKQDYEAKTEASVARLKNPLDGLAYVVLGLVAGLSTAQGNDWIQRGLAVDPFLRANERPPGVALFQGGALEAYFAMWDRLQERRQRWSSPEFERQMGLGETLFHEKRWEEAREAFQAAAMMDDSDYRPLLYQARILTETGDPEEAASQLNVLAGEYPQQWEIWHHLGLALRASQAYKRAEEAFRKALEESGDEPEPLFQLAATQILREDWDAARLSLQRYLERSPANAEAWTYLGICETHLKNWPAAVRAFREALAIDPEQEEARAGLKNATIRLEP